MDENHELQRLIDNLKERDRAMLDEMDSMFGGGPTLENRLVLANARATDALSALCLLARYVMDNEQKVSPNDLAKSPGAALCDRSA